jgi:hypothetical protein
VIHATARLNLLQFCVFRPQLQPAKARCLRQLQPLVIPESAGQDVTLGVDPELQNRLVTACLSSAMGGQSVFGCFPMEALYGYKNQDDGGKSDCEVHRTDQVAYKLVSYFLMLELSAGLESERLLQRLLVSHRVTTMLQSVDQKSNSEHL